VGQFSIGDPGQFCTGGYIREGEQEVAAEEAQWRERQRARELLLLKSPAGRRRRY
jgi:hypothetical protein